MRKKIFIQLFVIFTIISSVTNAQELKNYNLYNQNPLLYNPALAINDNFLMAYTNAHLQWMSLEGSPKSYDLGATMNFFPNMGAGITIASAKQGLLSNLYANMKYAYKIDISDEQYLKMGVSLGIANDRVLYQNAENVDLTDEHLTTDYYNKTVFTSGFGLYYNFKGFNAQIAMPQLFEYNALNIYTIGVLGYDYALNDDWVLKPSVMFRGAAESPFQFDGNIGAIWKEMVWGQVSYRSNNSIIAGVGVNFNNYAVGYAYQADMNPLISGSTGSHEIQLMFKFNNSENQPLIIPKVNVFGTVTDKLDNKPISAQIGVFENKTSITKIKTDSQKGHYGTALEPEKTYTLKVTAKGYYPKEENITLTKGIKELEHNIKLISKTALITGKITNKITGQPAESEVSFLEGTRVVKTVKTDADGNYSTELTKEKTYTIKVKADNYDDKEDEISIKKEDDKLVKDMKLSPNLTLTGKITDSKTGTPLSAKLDLYNLKTNKLVGSVNSDADGNYSLSIPNIESFSVSVSADKYLFLTENFDIDFTNFENTKDFALQPLEVGASIILKNIFFDTGKSDLRPESYTEIDRLIFVMMQNPTLRVKISGHTDNTGTVAFNNQLSKDRAQSVVDYMVSKGIKKERLMSEGFGSSKPIDTNDTEEGKQNNRRVEAEVF